MNNNSNLDLCTMNNKTYEKERIVLNKAIL